MLVRLEKMTVPGVRWDRVKSGEVGAPEPFWCERRVLKRFSSSYAISCASVFELMNFFPYAYFLWKW